MNVTPIGSAVSSTESGRCKDDAVSRPSIAATRLVSDTGAAPRPTQCCGGIPAHLWHGMVAGVHSASVALGFSRAPYDGPMRHAYTDPDKVRISKLQNAFLVASDDGAGLKALRGVSADIASALFKDGSSALEWAIYNGWNECARYLVQSCHMNPFSKIGESHAVCYPFKQGSRVSGSVSANQANVGFLISNPTRRSYQSSLVSAQRDGQSFFSYALTHNSEMIDVLLKASELAGLSFSPSQKDGAISALVAFVLHGSQHVSDSASEVKPAVPGAVVVSSPSSSSSPVGATRKREPLLSYGVSGQNSDERYNPGDYPQGVIETCVAFFRDHGWRRSEADSRVDLQQVLGEIMDGTDGSGIALTGFGSKKALSVLFQTTDWAAGKFSSSGRGVDPILSIERLLHSDLFSGKILSQDGKTTRTPAQLHQVFDVLKDLNCDSSRVVTYRSGVKDSLYGRLVPLYSHRSGDGKYSLTPSLTGYKTMVPVVDKSYGTAADSVSNELNRDLIRDMGQALVEILINRDYDLTCKRLTEESATFEANRARLLTEIQSNTGEVAKLWEDYQRMDTAKRELETHINKLTKDIHEIEGSLGSLNERLTEKTKDHKFLQDMYSDLEIECQVDNADVEKKKNLVKQRRELENCTTAIASMERDIDTLTRDKKGLSGQLEGNQNRVADLEKKQAETLTNIRQLVAKGDQLTQKSQAIKGKTTALAERKRTLGITETRVNNSAMDKVLVQWDRQKAMFGDLVSGPVDDASVSVDAVAVTEDGAVSSEATHESLSQPKPFWEALSTGSIDDIREALNVIQVEASGRRSSQPAPDFIALDGVCAALLSQNSRFGIDSVDCAVEGDSIENAGSSGNSGVGFGESKSDNVSDSITKLIHAVNKFVGELGYTKMPLAVAFLGS